jgi:glycosyltransferase involved in cell wall biosynthesis
MTARRAVVIGAARNCARHLSRVLENLALLGGLYAEVCFVFAVSDSTDGTLGLIEKWLAQGHTGKALDLGDLEKEIPIRSARIATARNACLDEVRRSPGAAHDHLIVADLDDALDCDLSVEAFGGAANWLDASAERAGVFANATPRYYDIWALRHDSWCSGDCWHPIWGRDPGEPFEVAKIREVFRRQIEIPVDLPPFAVRSAFGGLGLYKMSYALGGVYCGIDHQDRPVSEHVAFNQAIGAAGGQLHIFPTLVVKAPQQHLYNALEFGWRWRLAMLGWRFRERRNPPWRALMSGRAGQTS